MRGHGRLLCFPTAAPQGNQQFARWAATPQFTISDKENSGLSAAAERRVPRGRRSAGRAGFRVLATRRAINTFCEKQNVCAHKDDGYVRKKPWGSSLRGVLLVLFCRHGQKSTFIQQIDSRPINGNLRLLSKKKNTVSKRRRYFHIQQIYSREFWFLSPRYAATG